MDSLTQIVLGAAMGEAVAGRKIGNRAMLWGAIAGTIPDLDVFGGLFGMSPEDNLAFHRGISHSIFFAFLAPLLLAAYTHWYYNNNYHKQPVMRYSTAIAGFLFIIFCAFIVNFFPQVISGSISWPTLTVASLLVIFFGYRLFFKYANNEQEEVKMPYMRWYLLFFIAVFTHPILDSCTGYGTQLFQPFSDYRVAWNNISVADPLYTGPFLLFLILAATRKKTDRVRTILNYIGIAWSMIYMGWTIRNKIIVDRVFTQSLVENNIEFSRCMTTPSILNNILWHCIAEGDSVYYDGYYSLNDKNPIVTLQEIEKNHHLLDMQDDKRVKTIKWFTNNYYNVMVYNEDTLQVNDLRYGAQINGDPNKPSDYIFPFQLTNNGSRYFLEDQSGPPEGSMEDFWNILWTRVAGI